MWCYLAVDVKTSLNSREYHAALYLVTGDIQETKQQHAQLELRHFNR